MKDFVLILSKTLMNRNQVCIGGLTSSGRYVRLIDSNGNNQPENTDFAPRQAWEIKFEERENTAPPHVEDVIVLSAKKIGVLRKEMTIKDFIQKRNIPIWTGSLDELFDNLVQWSNSGSGYVDKRGGIPNHSVGFWISDKDLIRYEYNGIRYRYPVYNGWRNVKYKGVETPVEIIPAGTLIGVSLARWHSFDLNEQPKCWLQLSGWYDLGLHSDVEDGLPF